MTNTITKNPKQNLDKKDSEKEMILKGVTCRATRENYWSWHALEKTS